MRIQMAAASLFVAMLLILSTTVVVSINTGIQSADAVTATSLQIFIVTKNVPWSHFVTVAGKLSDAATNAGIANKVIFFDGSGGMKMTRIITNPDGSFAASGLAPDSVATGWTVKAHFAGDLTFGSSNSNEVTYNTVKHNAKLTLQLSPETVDEGANYDVSGTLKDALTNKPIGSQTVSFTADSPIIIEDATTDSSGSYSVAGQVAPAADTYNIQAHFSGTSLYNAADSQARTLTVTGSPPPSDVDGDGFTVAEGDCNDNNALVYPGAPEVEANGIDDDCDGLVDETSTALFVSMSGSDDNAGTSQSAPLRNINTAISKAVSEGNIQDIFVSEGTYEEHVVLANGMSLYGGYSEANGWVHDPSSYFTIITNSAVTGGRIIGVSGNNILDPTTVDGLSIITGDAGATDFEVSNYALHCNNCDGLTLSNNIIIAGNGGTGVGGANGSLGVNGGNGEAGTGGACDDQNAIGQGGDGGTSDFGLFGGNGGDGGSEANDGQPGGTGFGGTPGGVGGSGDTNGDDGTNGSNGANGAAGGDGQGGSGGSAVGGFWVSSNGVDGANGAHGHGGGGGGGGGGQGGAFVIDGAGNGGGGGGAGGSRGLAAAGGTAGGGSFAVFLVDSDGIQLINNQITSGDGGNGGNGGTGGTGGEGGSGGLGARVCLDEVGAGGNGGNGGDGGRGGHGGGGAGGVSYAVYTVTTSVVTTGNTLSHGSGGLGGASAGNPGSVGAAADNN